MRLLLHFAREQFSPTPEKGGDADRDWLSHVPRVVKGNEAVEFGFQGKDR
jgi:hypothetical protein